MVVARSRPPGRGKLSVSWFAAARRQKFRNSAVTANSAALGAPEIAVELLNFRAGAETEFLHKFY